MAGKRVTIVDVARAVGVSPSTVSLVLRGDPSISPPTVERVRAAMQRLGYVYNRGAAALRDHQAKMLGVVLHDLANSVLTEIALGANVVARSLGYVQIVAHTDDELESQRDVINGLREYGVRGIILSPAHGTSHEELAGLRESGLTVVLAGRGISGDGVSRVRSDHVAGISTALGYLRRLGHERISFVGGFRDTDTFSARATAFAKAMAASGLPVGPDDVIASGQSAAGGVEGLRQLMERPAGLPTAIMCFNDPVALGVYEGLRAAGLRPGEDVSVVGFDDIPAARALYPALTTVSIGARTMGETATRLLLELLDSGDRTVREVVTPVRLVIRDSCTPPARPAATR